MKNGRVRCMGDNSSGQLGTGEVVNYGGNCRQAYEFYEKHLGGKITMLTTRAEVPDPSSVPPEWRGASQ